MRHALLIVSAALSGAAITGTARADAVTAMPLSSYTCAELRGTAQEIREQTVPVYAEADYASERIGTAPFIMLVVKTPPRNGFVRMVMLDNQDGWIQASKIQPYAPPPGVSAHCTPGVLRNSVLGPRITP